MGVMTIFAIQFSMSLVVWGSLACWLLPPWLKKKSLNEALFFLTVPHAFRHIGMVFLVPSVVAGPLPEIFAAPAALGDLLTEVLAFFALILLSLLFGKIGQLHGWPFGSSALLALST